MLINIEKFIKNFLKSKENLKINIDKHIFFCIIVDKLYRKDSPYLLDWLSNIDLRYKIMF